MALGSPASPSSGTGVYSNQQQSGAQYLPGFLMGDITSQVISFSNVCFLNFVIYKLLSLGWWSTFPNQPHENDEGALNVRLFICFPSFSISPDSKSQQVFVKFLNQSWVFNLFLYYYQVNWQNWQTRRSTCTASLFCYWPINPFHPFWL